MQTQTPATRFELKCALHDALGFASANVKPTREQRAAWAALMQPYVPFEDLDISIALSGMLADWSAGYRPCKAQRLRAGDLIASDR